MDTTIFVKRASSAPLRSVVDQLWEMFDDAEPVMRRVYTLGDVEVALLVFERYYFRNGDYASVTIQLTSHNGWQRATIVGAGGGSGLLNISRGANEAIAASAFKRLEEIGFSK